ncbi:MAG: alpha-amylase [Clostridiales bacterium]|nr:alpha-amylase [Clostridiales bacterium]
MFDYRIEAGRPTRLGVTRAGKDINFAAEVRDGRPCSLILYPRGTSEIAAELEFTEEMRCGDIYTMRICRFPMNKYEYNYRIDGEVKPDPYAGYVTGREKWGVCPESPHEVRCGVCFDSFSWQGDRPLELPYEECVLYVTHPRGFTMDASSRVRHPGTLAGIREKIPYLKKLGITQLELMPVYEFAEAGTENTAKKHMPIRRDIGERVNYWGYTDACYFAPKASYSASGNPVREMKELVRELHKNGIELILEFYFPIRTNPNLILDCIKYWVSEYHIDGVHVNSWGTPVTVLALEPHLARTKLMSEAFPMDQIYEPEYEPGFRRLAEYNDDFLIKARRFLKGDEDMLWQITESMRRNPEQYAVVNYMANHNGFTLMDTVSYDVKHNEENGEDNRDGSSYNYSCNYGEEGATAVRALERLRRRQLRNAFLLVLLSQGVPAIYGGDEMGNSQKGNNNVYCQDNELSWIQWSRKKADKGLQEFVREAIAFRRSCPAFGRRNGYTMKDCLSKGMPDLSYHGKKAWYGEFENYNRQVGILYAGAYTGGETCYVLYNMHMTEHELALPTLPAGQRWHLTADTGREYSVFYPKGEEPLLEDQKMVKVPPRTIMILAGKSDETD